MPDRGRDASAPSAVGEDIGGYEDSFVERHRIQMAACRKRRLEVEKANDRRAVYAIDESMQKNTNCRLYVFPCWVGRRPSDVHLPWAQRATR